MDDQLTLLDVESKPAPIIPPGFYIGRPRPNHAAREILMAVANNLLPQVMRWMGKNSEDKESEVVEQLLNAFERSDRDGYRLAKYLENHYYWDADNELVEILDGADFYGCHRDAVESWIRDNGIVPTFEVGRQVMVKERRRQEEMVAGTNSQPDR